MTLFMRFPHGGGEETSQIWKKAKLFDFLDCSVLCWNAWMIVWIIIRHVSLWSMFYQFVVIFAQWGLKEPESVSKSRNFSFHGFAVLRKNQTNAFFLFFFASLNNWRRIRSSMPLFCLFIVMFSWTRASLYHFFCCLEILQPQTAIYHGIVRKTKALAYSLDRNCIYIIICIWTWFLLTFL